MPAKTGTGFCVIDTYNFIKEVQASPPDDYDDDFSAMEQQQIPQFLSSSSSTPPPSSSSSSFPVTQPMRSMQQIPSSSPSSFSPSYSSVDSSYSSISQTGGFENQQMQAYFDMDMNSSFLEDLISQHISTPTPVPFQATSPTPISRTPTPTPTPTSTTYVSEGAVCGGTVIQTAAEVTQDQQLLDMDMVELCDLDKNSFYDDKVMEHKVIKTEAVSPYSDWVTELGPEDSMQQLIGGGSVTELGPVTVLGPVMPGNEQDDIMSYFDSFRKDLMMDCQHLNISPDPQQWSALDTQTWVVYTLDKHQRPDDCSTTLTIAGRLLCSKSEEEFRWISPSSGAFLRQQLDLWMTVVDLPAIPPKPQQASLATLTPAGVPTTLADACITQQPNNPSLSYLPPSVSPAPSTDSACSSQSSSPSSSSTSSLSEAEFLRWCQDPSSEEDLFVDATKSLTQPEPAVASTPTKRPTPATTPRQGGRPGKQIRLWEFLKELLEDGDSSLKWLNRATGVFKIEDSNRVARLWGIRKNHPAMNYDKLSRSVRQYYKKGIIKKTTQTRRLVYQFCEGIL